MIIEKGFYSIFQVYSELSKVTAVIKKYKSNTSTLLLIIWKMDN